MDTRKGPWTVEEDLKLIRYINTRGVGRWNYLARCTGLKRSGKSCRLRWVNYLSPDVRRGNITLEEQLVIHQLHSQWGNRWSKIAQHLPGRTDNEIKNYWRTRAKEQLKCHPMNTPQSVPTMCQPWLPSLPHQVQPSPAAFAATSSAAQLTSGFSGPCELVVSLGSLEAQLSPNSVLTETGSSNSLENGAGLDPGSPPGFEPGFEAPGHSSAWLHGWDCLDQCSTEDDICFLHQQLYDHQLY